MKGTHKQVEASLKLLTFTYVFLDQKRATHDKGGTCGSYFWLYTVLCIYIYIYAENKVPNVSKITKVAIPQKEQMTFILRYFGLTEDFVSQGREVKSKELVSPSH